MATNRTQLEVQAKDFEQLTLANAELRAHIDLISKKLEQYDSAHTQFSTSNISKKINEVEELLEERTNRQLRQTLVFRGVREVEDESWEDTSEIIAKLISKNLGISSNKAHDMLNRVHRGKPANINKNSPRPIYAALFKWHDCEELVEGFRDLNINQKSSIRVSYMYGPKTSLRRGLALVERKNLKDSGAIISGYLAYPARLFGKTPGSNNYKLIKDFSNHEVTLNPKN